MASTVTTVTRCHQASHCPACNAFSPVCHTQTSLSFSFIHCCASSIHFCISQMQERATIWFSVYVSASHALIHLAEPLLLGDTIFAQPRNAREFVTFDAFFRAYLRARVSFFQLPPRCCSLSTATTAKCPLRDHYTFTHFLSYLCVWNNTLNMPTLTRFDPFNNTV